MHRSSPAPSQPPQPAPAPAEDPQGWIAHARQALAAGDLDRAGGWLEQVLDRDPYDPEGVLLQGQWLYRSGRQEAGLRLLLEQRSMERDPGRLAEIDARLAEWLPGFVQALDAAASLEFLGLVTRHLPADGRYAMELARRQSELGRHSDALYTLSAILYDPVWGDKARELEGRIRERSSWANGHRLPMETRGKQHLVTVRVNGRDLRLLIDTGASLTLLTEGAARRAGLSPAASARRIRMQTASGVAEAALVETGIELGGKAVGVRQVAVHETALGPEIDGLLGMDILGAYEFLIDQAQAALFLRPKD